MPDAPIRPPLLVFADDWGRHPSSCQHLIGRLLERYPVCWVNTIGMRMPRLNRATFSRGLEKFRHWLQGPPADSQPANPRVVNPRMWPWFRTRFDQRLNRALLVRQLTPVLRSLARPPVAITTLPLVADLVGVLPVLRWVYYCVDDFSKWPGLDRASQRRMEERLVRRADVLIAASETLRAKLAGLERPAHLLTHGIDLAHWASPGPPPAGLDDLPKPLIVFWGVIDRRMDVAFLRQLGADLQGGTLLLIGPEDAPDPALAAVPRLVRWPPLPYDELPAVGRAAAVLVMPYADLPVTRAMQPLKLTEYLATGRPVVARDLPATRAWADGLDLAATAEDFSLAVRSRLAEGLPDSQRIARQRLAGESWAEKARLMETWMLAGLSG